MLIALQTSFSDAVGNWEEEVKKKQIKFQFEALLIYKNIYKVKL